MDRKKPRKVVTTKIPDQTFKLIEDELERRPWMTVSALIAEAISARYCDATRPIPQPEARG